MYLCYIKKWPMLFTIEYSMNNQLYPSCFDLDLENLISSSLSQGPSVHQIWSKSMHAFSRNSLRDQPTNDQTNTVCHNMYYLTMWVWCIITIIIRIITRNTFCRTRSLSSASFFICVHVSCHVTQGHGTSNHHIFGILDPNLPIHYVTFVGLRWGLR